MSLQDPVAIYKAATNAEAHMVHSALVENGIDAYVSDDVSQVGIPEFNKSQVWVARTDVERVMPILQGLELKAVDREESQGVAVPIEVTCPECGQISKFPVAQKGSVQECPACHAYLDVGADDAESWPEIEEEGEPEA